MPAYRRSRKYATKRKRAYSRTRRGTRSYSRLPVRRRFVRTLARARRGGPRTISGKQFIGGSAIDRERGPSVENFIRKLNALRQDEVQLKMLQMLSQNRVDFRKYLGFDAHLTKTAKEEADQTRSLLLKLGLDGLSTLDPSIITKYFGSDASRVIGSVPSILQSRYDQEVQKARDKRPTYTETFVNNAAGVAGRGLTKVVLDYVTGLPGQIVDGIWVPLRDAWTEFGAGGHHVGDEHDHGSKKATYFPDPSPGMEKFGVAPSKVLSHLKAAIDSQRVSSMNDYEKDQYYRDRNRINLE